MARRTKNSDINSKQINITQEIKKRKRQRKMYKTIFVVGLVLTVVLYYSGVFASVASTSRGIFENVKISMMPKGQFPVQTGISEIYQLDEIEGGFVALAKESCIVYSADAKKLREIQAGYSRPAMSVGKDKYLLYFRSGTQLRVESRTQTLATKNFAQPIILAEMSDGGNFAVATQDEDYLAVVSVLSENMSELVSFSMTENEGIPIKMAFSPNSETVAIATLSTQDGAELSNVYLLSVGKKSQIKLASEAGSLICELAWLSSSELLAVYDTYAVLYDTKAKEPESAKLIDFGGQTLVDFSKYEKNLAFLLGEANNMRYIAVNEEFEIVHEDKVENAEQISLGKDGLFILKAEEILVVSKDAKTQEVNKQTIVMEETVTNLLQTENMLAFSKNKVDVLTVSKSTH